MTDIVERLREPISWPPNGLLLDEAADEIESLRRRLQDGSPVVEGTIQHMAMEIAALKKERDELKQNIRDMNEYMHKRIEAALAKLGADKEEV